MLAANGISHRTPPAVNSKIRILVQQYLAASVLLKNQKLPTDYLEQQIVDEEVKTQVLQLCPLHRELEPIFSRFDLSRMAPKVWTRCNDSEDSDFDEIIHVREPPPGADCSSSTRRRNTGPVRSIHEATSADELDPGETTVMVPVSTSAHDFHQEMGEQRLKSALLITRCHLQMQREKHECEMDIERCRLQTERHHGEVERKRDEMRFKMERKRDEMRFTMERRKLKMHLVVDTLESRKVLKDRRISNADIDAVLPLPEPMSE
ncbi:hypothetical protein PHMEG_0001448 [Phytophthora megakarya]|uniref:Uncharacterized protein n=1 Tax=Phytophthora megakarya TaxID=4795 RepID=A0A225X1P1_9STRA|nr:hypothetical protein PHMEG_0001448 [Phytophthora megakarya]